MRDSRAASRERFLASWAKCVTLQNPSLPPPEGIPYAQERIPDSSEEVLTREEFGNGAAQVECDVEGLDMDITRWAR